jgi:hypothetical protein
VSHHISGPRAMAEPAAVRTTIATGKLAFTDPGAIFELAARRGEGHRTCGGRAPNDDVMDTVFTLLVNAGNGPVIRDGIDRPAMLAPHQFPYLAPPNPDPPKAPHA